MTDNLIIFVKIKTTCLILNILQNNLHGLKIWKYFQPDVDAGAIIVQETVPIEVYDTEESLTERIKTAEHKAFPKALKLLATGKVRLGSDKKIFWC